MAACAKLGWGLCALSALSLPTDPRELEALTRLWEREAILSRSALMLDCDELDRSDAQRVQAVTRFLEGLGGLLFIAGHERQRLLLRPLVSLDVAKPTAEEQRELWRQTLGAEAASLNGRVESLVAQFSLTAPAIQSAAAEATSQYSKDGSEEQEAALGDRLWETCRLHPRPQLEGLAQRISSQVGWDDLVLPQSQLQTLFDIVVQVRQRPGSTTSGDLRPRTQRGLGISVLFSGASGTGKTLAAEVMANELRLDLYRIDLSQVVSKYIGETEKNLRRVFDAADDGGAVLFFDEADALFGKRSEVKDSHDRYANIEISYLLQRMESYRGLAILTTNMKSALDTAFLRRIRFIVTFPFPDQHSAPRSGGGSSRRPRPGKASIRHDWPNSTWLAETFATSHSMPPSWRPRPASQCGCPTCCAPRRSSTPSWRSRCRRVKWPTGCDEMNVRLHIDKLVLNGFPPVNCYRIAAAMEAELARLLTEQGVPPGLANGGAISRLDGGSFDVMPDARPDRIGVQVAQAVYGGLTR